MFKQRKSNNMILTTDGIFSKDLLKTFSEYFNVYEIYILNVIVFEIRLNNECVVYTNHLRAFQFLIKSTVLNFFNDFYNIIVYHD